MTAYERCAGHAVVGPPNGGKTAMAKQVAAMVGCESEVYSSLTRAEAEELLKTRFFHVVNDLDFTSKDNKEAMKVSVTEVHLHFISFSTLLYLNSHGCRVFRVEPYVHGCFLHNSSN